MKTIRIFLLLILVFIWNQAFSQTVVKMDMPQQADRPLRVVALFDEELPEGIPVVLGLMGYDVEGGTMPYFFEWLLNGEVISTSDVAIFTPQNGDDLSLKVTDNNECRASTAFNLKVASIPQKQEVGKENIKVYPTVFSHEIFIEFPGEKYKKVLVRIFDMNGIIFYQEYLSVSTSLNLNLSPGTYFISLKTDNLHKVEKIIAQ